MTAADLRWVDDPRDLGACCRALAGARRVALDTEFEANRERTVLCLVQLTAGQEIWVLDALRLDLRPLREVLQGPEVEWVLHAAREDVPQLVRALGLERPPTLLDLQVAWALLGPEPSVSLAYLVYRLLGLRTAKGHQADDWLQRPLPPSQLAYAADDVRHLLAMGALLDARLEALGRRELAREASAEQLEPVRAEPGILAVEALRNAWQLDAPQQAALVFLVDWVNGLPAEERRESPEAKVLLSLAAREPRTREDLLRMKGLPRRWAERHAPALLAGMRRAREQASRDFVPLEPPPYATWEELAADAWLAGFRIRVARRASAAPELVLPSRLLSRVKRAWLAGGDLHGLLESELGGWRARLLESAWRAELEVSPPPT